MMHVTILEQKQKVYEKNFSKKKKKQIRKQAKYLKKKNG